MNEQMAAETLKDVAQYCRENDSGQEAEGCRRKGATPGRAVCSCLGMVSRRRPWGGRSRTFKELAVAQGTRRQVSQGTSLRTWTGLVYASVWDQWHKSSRNPGASLKGWAHLLPRCSFLTFKLVIEWRWFPVISGVRSGGISVKRLSTPYMLPSKLGIRISNFKISAVSVASTDRQAHLGNRCAQPSLCTVIFLWCTTLELGCAWQVRGCCLMVSRKECCSQLPSLPVGVTALFMLEKQRREQIKNGTGNRLLQCQINQCF